MNSRTRRKHINKSKSVIKYIKSEIDSYKSYWMELGLSETQAELLLQMEIDEDIQSDDKPYLYRSIRLECGLTTLDEIIIHINRYKNLNQWDEPKDYSYEYSL